MNPALQALGAWCYRRAENVIAAMLAVMFVAFIIQIVFRYLLNFPIGWTQELTVIRKQQGRATAQEIMPCRFVKLIGAEGWDEA